MNRALSQLRSLLVAMVLLGVFISPLAWMALTSLKSSRQIATRPGDLLPTEVVASVDGRTVEVVVRAEVDSPAVFVRDRGTGVPALFPAAEWSAMTARGDADRLELIERLNREGVVFALVQPVEPGASATVVPLADVHERFYVRWANFTEAMAEMGSFGRYLGNTLFVCVMQIIGQVVAASLAAYGFAVLEWRGRDRLFALLLATMMIPFPVLMIPLYDLFRTLGWLGTLQPLWVPALFASAFNVFLMRQFLLGLPKSMFEAARLDGCTELRILWSLVVPLSKPVITTLVLFQFLFAWNDFLGPLIFLTDKRDYTISLALQFFQSQHGGVDWNLLMAASMIIAMPIVLIFFVAQRFLIGGIAMGGMK